MKKSNEMKGYFYDAAQIVLMIAVYSIVIFALVFGLMDISEMIRGAIRFRESDLPPAEVEVDAGIGRVEYASGQLYAAGNERTEDEISLHKIEIYKEGDSPVPLWFKPNEPMAVEWINPESVTVKDIGCPDWNLNTSIIGWEGHSMEAWELSLFSMIFYREFWQPNMILCEAGCDAMLRLWERDGGTMFETLSRINENGSYAFSTYPDVWEAEYDPDGLVWCKEFCEKRFYEGPVWPAQYFRKGQYHDWGEWSPIPAYEIDGIYFSIWRE